MLLPADRGRTVDPVAAFKASLERVTFSCPRISPVSANVLKIVARGRCEQEFSSKISGFQRFERPEIQ